MGTILKGGYWGIVRVKSGPYWVLPGRGQSVITGKTQSPVDGSVVIVILKIN